MTQAPYPRSTRRIAGCCAQARDCRDIPDGWGLTGGTGPCQSRPLLGLTSSLGARMSDPGNDTEGPAAGLPLTSFLVALAPLP